MSRRIEYMEIESTIFQPINPADIHDVDEPCSDFALAITNTDGDPLLLIEGDPLELTLRVMNLMSQMLAVLNTEDRRFVRAEWIKAQP